MNDQDLLREMTPAEVKALTPAQKKNRKRLRAAKYWREHYGKDSKKLEQVRDINAKAQVLLEQARAEMPKMGRPKGGKNKKRKKWTADQYLLARNIMNSPQFRAGDGTINWQAAFSIHPEWAQALDHATTNQSTFMSFVARVRNGKGTSILANSKALQPHVQEVTAEPVPTNGHGIMIGGRQFGLLELEEIVKAHQNALEPLRWCPECGYNLVMHTKAYSIAKRHSRGE